MSEKSTLYERVMSVLPCIIISALVLIPVGIGFLSTVNTTGKVTHVEDYSNCKDPDSLFPCNNFTYTSAQKLCLCHHPIHLKEDIIGDVTLYYELDFDQTNSTYANSRDNDQLRGHPGDSPADSCGAYRFDEENRTIFPCGEVADSMFNDTFNGLRPQGSAEDLPVSYSGILSADTATATPYHNPPKEVLEKFVKPKSWSTKREWEKSNSTGVENEAFRAWMDTSRKRKPVWRHVPSENYTDGLPAGNYTIKIVIYYPVDRYNGSRRLILEGVYPETRTSHVVIGSIALIIGLVALVAGLVLIFISKRNDEKYITCNDATLPVGDRRSHRPRTNDLEDISEETRLNKHN